MEIVEPCTYLGYILNYKVAGKILLKLERVLKGVMELRKRHRATFKPAIHDLVDALILYAVYSKRYLVNPWSVIVFQFNTWEFFQFSITTNNFNMLCAIFICALPDWYGRCPKAITAQIPVRSWLDSLSKAPLLDVFGKPVNWAVLLKHLFTLVSDIHKPTGVSTIHQSCSTAVTVRVTMTYVINLPDYTTLV